MKILSILLATIVLLGSCKKDYNCTCDVASYAVPVEGPTVNFKFTKTKKKEAKDLCAKIDDPNGVHFNCVLK